MDSIQHGWLTNFVRYLQIQPTNVVLSVLKWNSRILLRNLQGLTTAQMIVVVAVDEAVEEVRTSDPAEATAVVVDEAAEAVDIAAVAVEVITAEAIITGMVAVATTEEIVVTIVIITGEMTTVVIVGMAVIAIAIAATGIVIRTITTILNRIVLLHPEPHTMISIDSNE